MIQSGTRLGHLNTTSALEGFQKAGVLAQKWEGGGGLLKVEGLNWVHSKLVLLK